MNFAKLLRTPFYRTTLEDCVCVASCRGLKLLISSFLFLFKNQEEIQLRLVVNLVVILTLILKYSYLFLITEKNLQSSKE